MIKGFLLEFMILFTWSGLIYTHIYIHIQKFITGSLPWNYAQSKNDSHTYFLQVIIILHPATPIFCKL